MQSQQETGSDARHLCDQGGVAHGGRQADAEPLQVAVDQVRLGDQAERARVAQTNARQDDVAQLPAGRLHHRRVPEPAGQSDESESRVTA